MKKKNLIILISVSFFLLIATIYLYITLSHNRYGNLNFENELSLPDGKILQARTQAINLGIQKGDLFSYVLEVWYDKEKVSEIDKVNLDLSVNLNPFEIRDIKEQELLLNDDIKLFRREYTLQLITGKTGQIYEFPEITIRYKPKSADGLLTTTFSPESVFISSRLTTEVRELEFGYGPLRPIAPEIIEINRSLPWVFFSIGGLLAVVAVFELTQQATPRSNNTNKVRRSPLHEGVVFESYQALIENKAIPVEPRNLLHQMNKILRVVLAQKEKVDWLSELDYEKIPSEIRATSILLLKNCQKAIHSKEGEPLDVEDCLRLLDEVLEFYFGQEELATWRGLQNL